MTNDAAMLQALAAGDLSAAAQWRAQGIDPVFLKTHAAEIRPILLAENCAAFRWAAARGHSEICGSLLSDPQTPMKLRSVASGQGLAESAMLSSLFRTPSLRQLGKDAETWEYGAFLDSGGKLDLLYGKLSPSRLDWEKIVRNHRWNTKPVVSDTPAGANVNWVGLSNALRDLSYARISEIADSVKEISGYIAGYMLVRSLRPPENIHSLAALDAAALDARLEPFKSLAIRAFAEPKTLTQMAQMSDQWHRLRASLTKTSLHGETLRDFAVEGSWYPSLPGKELAVSKPGLEGYSIVNLTDAAELDAEGHRLKHCVSSYADDCKKEGYQIFSIRRNGEPQTTMGFHLKDGDIVFDQNLGLHNRSANAAERAVQDWFIEAARKGAVKLDLSRTGEIPREKTCSEIENLLGLRLADMTPERIDANLRLITAIHRGDTYMFGRENASAGMEEFTRRASAPAQAQETGGKSRAKEAGEQLPDRYYRYIGEYFARKYAGLEDGQSAAAERVASLRKSDGILPRILRKPITTRASDSGKTIVRWVENDDQIALLGMGSQGGRLAREDADFARSMTGYFADALARGKTIVTAPDENGASFVKRLKSALAAQGMTLVIRDSGAPAHAGAENPRRWTLSAAGREGVRQPSAAR